MNKEVTHINFSSSQHQSLVEDSRESIWLLTRGASRGEQEVLFKPFGFRASLSVLLEFDNEFHKRSLQGRTGGSFLDEAFALRHFGAFCLSLTTASA